MIDLKDTILENTSPPTLRDEIKYQNNITDSVGNTPLIKMNRLNKGLLPLMLCKAEFLNPGGSSKDRIGIKMLEAAERLGLLKPGGTIVESTSGNTGIALAFAAAAKGYKAITSVCHASPF